MSNYEGKLGEWLKYVQQQVESVKKPGEAAKAEEEPDAGAEEQVGLPVEIPSDVVARDRLGRSLAADATGVDTDSIIGDFSLIEDRGRRDYPGPALFDDEEIPQVEDYLPFLREREDEAPEQPPAPPETVSSDQRLFNLPEGTGDPKPVTRKPVGTPEPTAPELTTVTHETPTAQPVRVRVRRDAAVDASAIGQLWSQVPRHIQVLIGQVPKDSYKELKETREELIARLLDPIISLEEAASILNVCPTTVRRYTNRGALQHLRTAGNQRRFRLSDVLAFLEMSTRESAAS